MKTDWRQRITVDPEIHHGDPCVRGTRIPVKVILGSLADGFTTEEIVAEYPSLTADDVAAALAYAAELVGDDILVPLTA